MKHSAVRVNNLVLLDLDVFLHSTSKAVSVTARPDLYAGHMGGPEA